jgi:guanylate kinase
MKKSIVFLMWVTWSWKTTQLDNSQLLTHPSFSYVQSLTTRDLRPWEINWKKYRHISLDEFESYIYNWEMLEHAFVHQTAYYWTRLSDITQPWTKWKIAIKEIETKGLIHIIESWKIDWQFSTIFLDIPEDTLINRLQQRWTTDPIELERRLHSSHHERKHATQYCDFIIDGSWSIDQVSQRLRETLKNIYPDISVPTKFE